MRRPCAQNSGIRITTKTTTSMKIAAMLGRQAAYMCVSVDSSHETVHIMSTSSRVHLILGWYFGVGLYSGKCSIIIIIIDTESHVTQLSLRICGLYEAKLCD